MADNTLWVGALTAGTAVVASWVTSRGTARAARIQAETAAASQLTDRIRAARRIAYVDVIEQAQRMGDLYWKVTDTQDDPDADNRLSTLKDLRISLRDAYAMLRHRVWVVDLEGPQEVAAAAERLRRATSDNYRALEAMISGDADAGRRFNESYAPFWQAVLVFVSTAREALRDTAATTSIGL
ncbi:hypothetical protein [Streptomyces sp. NBC_01750]|uniref:hypothetical protein n=1 Tax=Streptomyces sp. NBC_01750 TaxID=2975928 RepID=UPI002DDC2F74|nr:hypothetical protein [Streptomyces sp. NBC_01750]WSD30882.1 hypothetical protein OG966_02340 [Streptomyces sp. NBC_01750]